MNKKLEHRFPIEWIVYNKTVVCSRSGKYKPRGKGKRTRQKVRAMQCGAQMLLINVCVRVINESLDDPIFSLCVAVTKPQHNHALNRQNYEQYAFVRTALASTVVETVDALRKSGAKKKNIMQFNHDYTDCSAQYMRYRYLSMCI
ncbi:hypothetical protein PHMEG_00017553 [Phytophthora megakarya]|uniref:Uncharacterized protein n=1 Tax=Phytophthora megakarya TaxID=4795 RepID=A0A225VWB0_9STRA|nr:hypothetical protein PHMEG_00017553 [Phytophthora megakarya]